GSKSNNRNKSSGYSQGAGEGRDPTTECSQVWCFRNSTHNSGVIADTPGGPGGSMPLHPLLPLGRGNYRKEGTGLFNELRDYSPFLPLPYWTKVQYTGFSLFSRKR